MLISPAHAQVAGAAPAGGGVAALLVSVAPFAAIMVAFWFLLIRPQQQRARALGDAIAAVKKGDQVVTAGGIVGRVTKVEDRFAEVEIAPNTRVRVVKATIAEVLAPGAKPAND